MFVSFVAISSYFCCPMSLFKGHVACPNLTLTGLRVNFSDSLIKGKEFLFELAGKVIRVRVIGALLYKQKQWCMRYWPSVRSILLLGIVKFILWLFYANRGQQGRKRRERPISSHLNASWTSHMTDIPWDIGDFKQLLRKRLVRWAEVIFLHASMPHDNSKRIAF